MLNSERRTRALDSLMEAALGTLGDVGFTRLRTADVAKRSGMSEGTLFRYFPTKYDLVRASLEQTLNRHFERLVSRFMELQTTTMIDRRALLTLLWELLSHPEMAWTFELFAAAYTDVELRATIAPVLNAHTEQVDTVGVSVMSHFGSMPLEDARYAINLATWSMQGLVLRDMARGDTGSQVELIDYLLHLGELAYPIAAPAQDSLAQDSLAQDSAAIKAV
jgi:AcrR family transcriptional regulator